MNDRIKELLGQAYDEAVPETWTTLSSEQLERVYKKFAELIVRECGRVADQWVNDEDNGTNLVSEKLKQHFGVKE